MLDLHCSPGGRAYTSWYSLEQFIPETEFAAKHMEKLCLTFSPEKCATEPQSEPPWPMRSVA